MVCQSKFTCNELIGSKKIIFVVNVHTSICYLNFFSVSNSPVLFPTASLLSPSSSLSIVNLPTAINLNRTVNPQPTTVPFTANVVVTPDPPRQATTVKSATKMSTMSTSNYGSSNSTYTIPLLETTTFATNILTPSDLSGISSFATKSLTFETANLTVDSQTSSDTSSGLLNSDTPSSNQSKTSPITISRSVTLSSENGLSLTETMIQAVSDRVDILQIVSPSHDSVSSMSDISTPNSNPISNRSSHNFIVIGGVIGGLAGLMLIVFTLVAFVAICRKHYLTSQKRAQQSQLGLSNILYRTIGGGERLKQDIKN